LSFSKNNESLYDESGEHVAAYREDEWVEWLSIETGDFERQSMSRTWFLANGEKLIPIDGNAFLGLLSGKRYFAEAATASAQTAK
jgi:hypothetical protein